MSAPPSIPPRPARSQNSPAPPAGATLDAPKVPARPKRSIERSVSPAGERYARSPLNDPTYLHNGPPPKDGSRLTTEVPSRPPSVSLPSLGEEGNEYASFEDLSKTLTNESLGGTSTQTRNVAGDLPLHAPTASVPSSTAKSRIQAVTRTDSSQAEAAGVGKSSLAPEDKYAPSKSGRSGSSIGSRPSSLYNDKEEHGIPEIGVQVPMFRNAGDVQAPSPAPFAQHAGGGVGFHAKTGGRHHGRTKSGREIFHGPPGSYGMHGHGVISNDEFEQKWYQKHPEDLKREKAGEYGPHIQENRKDYHWGADNLEKLVHTRSQDLGMGTSREAVSTPDEQIGFLASEQYASRMASPRPASSGRPASIKAGTTHVESPLRNESGDAINEAGEVIHIDPPAHRSSKIYGTNYGASTEDLGPEGGNTNEEGGWVTERGYGAPILASDELKKRGPDAEWRQPAVSPELERHGDEYMVNEDGNPSYITKARTHSRSSSRNNNVAPRAIPSPNQFDRGGTPLESTKEYEPLFPEDEDDGKKIKSPVEKLKRPTVARHHFPSQDVWEDTPGSLQLETTVETPEIPNEPQTAASEAGPATAFESTEQEEQRKGHITKEDQESFLPEHTRRFAAENKHLGKVRDEPGRPGLQRFPSQDIWEDAPSHGHLETTVSTPQQEDNNEYAEDSPVVEKPTVPARPNIPARPAKKEASASPIDKKAPIIPDRPKPQIPERPRKQSGSSLDRVISAESQEGEREAPAPKVKPAVPARPGGSKIAALQAGFLKDLNSKIGLGPQAPKPKESEPEQAVETAPLTDARKGRAKGPQRRKPATSQSPAPAATVVAEVAVPKAKLDFAPVTSIWSFGEDGELDVPAATMSARISEALQAPSKVQEPEVEAEATAELTKTATETSEPAPSILETLASKEAPVVPEPKEPLVKEVATGSVDAPGAFPGSEPTLGDEPPSAPAADASLLKENLPTQTKPVQDPLNEASALPATTEKQTGEATGL